MKVSLCKDGYVWLGEDIERMINLSCPLDEKGKHVPMNYFFDGYIYATWSSRANFLRELLDG